MRDLLRAKLGEIDGRLKAMREFRRTLARHLSACERELQAHGRTASCPVVVEITHARDAPEAVKGKEGKL